MSTNIKNWKKYIYWPITLGAVAFAAFGISSAIQAHNNTSGDGAVSATALQNSGGVVQTLQPNGGDCDPGNCAACGYCAAAQINQAIEVETTPNVLIQDNGETY